MNLASDGDLLVEAYPEDTCNACPSQVVDCFLSILNVGLNQDLASTYIAINTT